MLCVLVAGMPASGKSTLAARLSEELGWPMFSKDSMKELLFDTVGFRSRQEKVALGVGAMEILYYAAGQVLACGGSVILENNFENVSRPGLEALLEKYGCPAVTVLLTGDPAVIHRRFLERNASPDRHPGHVVNTCYPGPAEETVQLYASLEEFVKSCSDRGMDAFCIGETLQVDVTDLSAVDVHALAEEIRKLA